MQALSSLLQGRPPYSHKEPFLRVKKWKVIHAYSSDGGHLAVSVSKMVTTMLRHCDQKERQTDGSRHWDSIQPVLMRAFASERAQDFRDKNWLRLIHEGSTKKSLEYCTDQDGNFEVFPSYSGTLWWYSKISPELMKYTPIPYKWKEYIFHRGSSWIFQSIFGSGIIPGGKEKDRARQAQDQGNWCNPFLKWMWILILVTKKSAQMHSRTTKRIITLLNESNWFKQDLYSRRSGEREDGV